MPDLPEIYDLICASCIAYGYQGAWATAWNFRFMDNLYQFGKDFH